MRSYTNKKGELTTVSQEHLDTAVELKLLLQHDSNANRCSWAKHKQLMKKEGFEDSENSENYRKMIMNYQKEIGKLPTADTYADKVVTSKLESYKELVGEVKWEKHENQKYLRKINKGKREIVDGVLFIEEVKAEIQNALSQVHWEEIMNHTFSPIARSGGTRMILALTDWHIGALVDVDGNRYNYEVAKRRINDAVEQAIAIATERKVYRIDVVYMGDILEHAYMRDAQAYHAEFPVTRQMTLGGRLMIDALYKLSHKFFVSYRGFAGNHDRMNKDKNGNIDGDTGMVVVNEMVQLWIEQMQEKGIENIAYAECHNYNAKLINVNGRNFKFVHGDLEKRADTGKLADHSSNDKIIYDAIVYGHFHHYMVLEVGVDRFEIRVGSTKGSDDYSEKLGVGSAPSQAVILVSSNGDIDVKRLRLK
jgi:predicted phosphodiesterase